MPSFIMALRENLTLPGEDLKTFSADYKTLSEEDKDDLSKWMAEEGIEHDPPRK
jgi:hypothetical protein